MDTTSRRQAAISALWESPSATKSAETAALLVKVAAVCLRNECAKILRAWADAEKRARLRVVEAKKVSDTELDLDKEISVEFARIDPSETEKIHPANLAALTETGWIDGQIRGVSEAELALGDDRPELFRALVGLKTELEDTKARLTHNRGDPAHAFGAIGDTTRSLIQAADGVSRLIAENPPADLKADGPAVRAKRLRPKDKDDAGNPLPDDFPGEDWRPSKDYVEQEHFTHAELQHAVSDGRISRVKLKRKNWYRKSEVRVEWKYKAKYVDDIL